MAIQLSATITDSGDVELSWVDDGTPPASVYTVRRQTDGGTFQEVGFTPPARTTFVDPGSVLVDGVVYGYQVEGDGAVLSNVVDVTPDVDAPTFGPVDWLELVPRYTDLPTVKRRLGMDVGSTVYDDELTQTIVAAESTIDAHLGRSFPDDGPNPAIPGIPQAVRVVATQIAVRVWKEADRAGQSAGSDDWFGTIDLAGATAQAIDQNPSLVGLRASFGIG